MTDSKPQTPTPPPSQTGFRERKLEGGKKQPQAQTEAGSQAQPGKPADMPKEVGGPPGPEPTRYGDWAFKGRVTDF